MERVRVNGLDVAYRRIGNGTPIVFVHGAVEDSRTWTPQFEALQDELSAAPADFTKSARAFRSAGVSPRSRRSSAKPSRPAIT